MLVPLLTVVAAALSSREIQPLSLSSVVFQSIPLSLSILEYGGKRVCPPSTSHTGYATSSDTALQVKVAVELSGDRLGCGLMRNTFRSEEDRRNVKSFNILKGCYPHSIARPGSSSYLLRIDGITMVHSLS